MTGWGGADTPGNRAHSSVRRTVLRYESPVSRRRTHSFVLEAALLSTRLAGLTPAGAGQKAWSAFNLWSDRVVLDVTAARAVAPRAVYLSNGGNRRHTLRTREEYVHTLTKEASSLRTRTDEPIPSHRCGTVLGYEQILRI